MIGSVYRRDVENAGRMLMAFRHNLPPDVEALFTKTPPIKDVIEFALGSQGTYFISYRDHDGQIFCSKYAVSSTYLGDTKPYCLVFRQLQCSITINYPASYVAHNIQDTTTYPTPS